MPGAAGGIRLRQGPGAAIRAPANQAKPAVQHRARDHARHHVESAAGTRRSGPRPRRSCRWAASDDPGRKTPALISSWIASGAGSTGDLQSTPTAPPVPRSRTSLTACPRSPQGGGLFCISHIFIFSYRCSLFFTPEWVRTGAIAASPPFRS